MKMPCNMDCLNCIFPDCINDKVRPEYASNKWENKTHEQKAHYNLWKKQRREDALKNGLCGTCWKKPLYRNYCQCYECYMRRKRWEREHKQTPISVIRKMNGYCQSCNSPAVSGYKYCEKHLALARAAFLKGSMAAKEKRLEKRSNTKK
ncbi:MAG: hypothetical protein J5997_13710 [Oscillospiraceae bacterium]|nr:hypothetical protein [Oscillospiraceae bacterium]